MEESGLDAPAELKTEQGEIGVRPDVSLLEDYLRLVSDGRLRVPKFQRPFVWRPDQMLDLFDSIERGYPIGSMLLWETPSPLESLGEVGGLTVPDPPAGRTATYILDGHQRLSTLYGCLYRPDYVELGAENEWIWRVYRVLGSNDSHGNRYAHWKQGGPPPANYLPVRSVLKTLDFLAYARKLMHSSSHGERSDDLVEEAERVAQRIKSYKVSVVTLLGGTLAQAVEVFARINSKGQSMTPDQMVSALTYKGGEEESLADGIATVLERIAAEGFGQVDSTAAFRAVLAVAGETEVTGARWDVLARRLEGRVSRAVAQMDRALTLAVAFLRDRIGAPLARLVPYNNQLILLALFFHLRPAPSAEQVDTLERWFWITSWSGFFASINSSSSRQSIRDMVDLATEVKSPSDFVGGQGMFDFTDQRARPFPEKFDMRSARVRAYILWELRRRPDGHAWAVDQIRALEGNAFRRVSNRVGLPNGSSPGNRVMLETPIGVSVRNAILDGAQVGISPEALRHLASGDDEAFVKTRANDLAQAERRFIESITSVIEPYFIAEAAIDTD
ncbi:DUF262 domain-containing protein [Herbidospora daliensis]|uniref:DUF262 domain-containing protein n=1 Tax=Herbidospora daliensis TaxID=295585 RepID=UPI00078578DD|nr:DUF262 domain-containing protein [Herbidospora daliensis]